MKLGSTLRAKAPGFVGGEGVIEVPGHGPHAVAEVMSALGIRSDEVNIIYRNHQLVAVEASVANGDRVALFPPNFIHFSQFYLRRKVD
ncbi:MAG: MoaD/ThiS family protein [Actinobacteria bacterium]|nr:MoaD/ThiS family protein [Actinomycetota bacterium]